MAKKIDFSGYAVLTDVIHGFQKKPGFTWTIRPQTVQDEIRVQQLINQNTRFIADEDGRRIPIPPTRIELAVFEIATTFGGTTLKTDDGEFVIKSDAPLHEVLDLLHNMPTEMINELWIAVGKANPMMGPSGSILALADVLRALEDMTDDEKEKVKSYLVELDKSGKKSKK